MYGIFNYKNVSCGYNHTILQDLDDNIYLIGFDYINKIKSSAPILMDIAPK